MSMPLPAERGVSLSFWGMSSPLSRAHDGACRSLLSGGVPSHSEEWVLHSPELVIGLTLRSEFSALELLIGSWVPLISEEWVLRSPELAVGRASTAPLNQRVTYEHAAPVWASEFLRPPELCDRSLACWSSQHCSPQPEGHLWACRSLLSVWVPSHSEEWVVLRSKA